MFRAWLVEQIAEAGAGDAAGMLREHRWKGKSEVQFQIEDAAAVLV